MQALLPLLGISLSLSAGALLLGWLLLLLTGTTSYYILSLLAVLFSSWYGGTKAGFITTGLTVLAIDYLFIPPQYSLLIHPLATVVDLIIFAGAGIIIVVIIDKVQNTTDVLDYKHKEQEYLKLLTQLQKENVQFQKEVKARDEFLSIASHELKTPLSAMLLQIQTALYNIRNVSLANFSVEKLLKMLQSTEQQSKRLSKMINDLLNVSLITTGRLELDKEEADLSLLVKEVVDRFSERAEREKSPITFKGEAKVIGDWDKLRIDQAVTNLIANAIKYGDAKPIEIHVAHHDGMGKIAVTDHGIGIPMDRQAKIFERFERAVSNHTYKGLGVGLYITHQIVKTHHGNITLRSKPNDGSTFIIELPLKDHTKRQTTAV